MVGRMGVVAVALCTAGWTDCSGREMDTDPASVGDVYTPDPADDACGGYRSCGSCVRTPTCAWCDGQCVDGIAANECINVAQWVDECNSVPSEPPALEPPARVIASSSYDGMIALDISIPEHAEYFKVYGQRVEAIGESPPEFTASACALTTVWEPIPADGRIWFEDAGAMPFWLWVEVAHDVLGGSRSGVGAPVQGAQCVASGCDDAMTVPTFQAFPWCG